MLKKILFLITFLGILTSAKATHIVGGEIEMKHEGGDNYRLRLNLYFDAINGSEGALDPSVWLNVFRKSDNVLMGYAQLPKVSDTPIAYTDPKCAVGNLRTRHIIYEQVFNLPAASFNSPQGYYLSWERCCRNRIIQNIVDPGVVGQAFYMEFPSLANNGVQFINSTPSLPKPNNPYACLNQPFTLDWGSTDPDGDQLVYSLRTPAGGNSSTFDVAPFGIPAPYAPITWLSGYGVNNMIQGNPPLQISQNGLITFTPNREGLFVFAVVCAEFRNGVKIGETVREFQIMVLDCGGNTAPQAKLKLIDSDEFYDDSDVMLIDADATNKCTKLQVTDIDKNTVIKAKVTGIGFDASGILKQTTGNIVNGASDKLLLDVCFDGLPARCTPYEIDFEVEDNTCGSPLRSKQRVKVLIQDNTNAIVPILECIFLNEDGTKTATFGYHNFNNKTVSIPNGNKNKINGANFTNQTTDFQIGRWYHTFQVTYSGNQIPTWDITVGDCKNNTSKTDAGICASPCAPKVQRYLVKNIDNEAGILLSSPQKIEIDFLEGAYIEVYPDGNAYLFADVKVRNSDDTAVPLGSLWRLRLYLDKSSKAFCPNKGNLGDAITAALTNNWDYFEINTLKSSFLQINGAGTVNLAQKFGDKQSNFNLENCYGFQLGASANGKNNQVGASSQLFFSINYRDEPATGSLNINLEEVCKLDEPCVNYAIRVIEYNPQKRKDGLPIDTEEPIRRNNPLRALGAPQENDAYNFVSLGFGGNIVLELGSPVRDWNKVGIKAGHPNIKEGREITYADLVVVETSFGEGQKNCGVNQNENYPERAKFYGTESLDKEWVLLAEDCRTTFIDVAPAIKAGHEYVRYLKVVDVSDPALFVESAEGYDVDGIITCPESVTEAITGTENRKALLDARVESAITFRGDFFNRAPNEVQEYRLLLYPNPATDKAFIRLSLPKQDRIQVQVIDLTGRVMKNIALDANEGANQIEVGLSENPKGLYLIKISTENGEWSKTVKVIKD